MWGDPGDRSTFMSLSMHTTDWINSGVAICTLLVAVATGFLARWTQKLAAVTTTSLEQTDRHHREDLRPFCVIHFANATYPQFPFGQSFAPREGGGIEHFGEPARPAKPWISVSGELSNKGNGIAKSVTVYLNARRGEGDAGAFWLTRRVAACGLIGARDSIPIDIQITEHDVIPIWDGKSWKPTLAFWAIPNETYEVVLEYEDAFGDIFRTIHSRGIWINPIPNFSLMQDTAKQAKIMVRESAPMPIFRTGRQEVRTLADLSSVPQADAPCENGDLILGA